MATKAFFVNDKTGKKFEIMSGVVDGVVMLKGEYSTFPQDYNKEQFQKIGYRLERVEVPDAPAATEDDED